MCDWTTYGDHPNSTRVDTASTQELEFGFWTTSLFLDANTASMSDIGVM